MERLIAKMGINFKNGPTLYRGAVSNPAKRRRQAFSAVAFLAVLAVGLLFLLPGGLLQAQDNGDIMYAEDRMDPVRSFTSMDPEGDSIEWDVRGLDAADFTISSTGVLEFKDQPDFEDPTDRARSPTYDSAGHRYTAAGIMGLNNVYQVTVSATEVRNNRPDNTLPAKRTDIDLTITVMNVDEPGEVELSWLQPEVGTPIMATLTDPDNPDPNDPVTNVSYDWTVSKVADPEVETSLHWNTATGGGRTTAEYTPNGVRIDTDANQTVVDEGRYLRVMVRYTDELGSGKEAVVKSMLPVRAEVTTGIAEAPADNGSPDFQDDKDARTVAENLDVGSAVGAPFRAIEPDPEDVLTYTLEAADEDTDTRDLEVNDVDFFYIDNLDENGNITGMGQIKVKEDLDFEMKLDANGDADGKYYVVVRATDPSGESDTINVTITAENVNESPSVDGYVTLTVREGITDADDMFVYNDLPLDVADVEEHEYIATEPDLRDSIATWHLEGDDASMFDLSGHFEPRYLNFKKLSDYPAPDYENPRDENQDNVYEVTIVATDTGGNDGRIHVTVVVDNVDEPGEVVFTEGSVPYFDQKLVAQVHDPDDHGGDLGEPYQDVRIVTWQWSWSQTEGGTFENYPEATTNEYTPNAETDGGRFLRVTATYTDPLSAMDDAGTGNADERVATTGTPPSLRSVMATTENAVRAVAGQEAEPSFTGGTGTVTTTIIRYVREDVGPDGDVGAPVAAEISGGATLVYTLEGTDAQYFKIDSSTGQITVAGDPDPSNPNDPNAGKMDPMFDYNDPQVANNYRVTVKAAVQGGLAHQSAEVRVNIRVTDVDEGVSITAPDVDDLTQPIPYPEIDEDGSPNTAAVVTFTGTDPEGAGTTWDVRGADAALFTIDGGVLKFKNPPDFEDPKDRVAPEDGPDNGSEVDDFGRTTPTADAGQNTYSIVVRSIATRRSGDTWPAQTTSQPVTVNVTNVDEPGVVTINWLQPEIDVAIMATLEDPDSPDTQAPTVVSWAWTVSNVAIPDRMNDDHWRPGQGDGPNSATYTPVEADTPDADFERFLRATVTYMDGEGSDKTERAVSVKPVQDAGGGAENGSPDFENELEERTVQETAAVGIHVGNAVTASVQSPSVKDTLTYGIRAVAPDDLDDILEADRPSITVADHAGDPDVFSIDKASGQITVAGGLNFERGTPFDGKYVVVVTVTDPSAESTNMDPAVVPANYRGTDDVVVVITATDVNEAPVLDGRVELTINEVRELTITEMDDSPELGLAPDFDGNTDMLARADLVNYYTVMDEDGRDGISRWDLEGDDANLFRLTQVTGRTLEFNNPPDYENPLDEDGDNVYEVTVVAYDNVGVAGKFDVCIVVGNVNETGTVTFVDANGDPVEQPVARTPVTAEISDPDGLVEGTISWQWSRNPNPAALGPVGAGPFDPHGFGVMPLPTGATYTPGNMNLADVAQFLRATATYTDGAVGVVAGDRTMSATTKHAVLAVMDLHRAPVFNPYTITLEIAEGSPTETYIGAPLPTATDPDGTDDETTYELGGDHIDYFELLPPYDHDDDPNTPMQLLMQVRVKPIDVDNPVTGDRPMIVFNHEGEDEGTNEYTVELMAIDATEDRALDATLTVNIVVTNRNEAPSVPAAAPEGLRIEGYDALSYTEGGTDVVETYEIAGPGAGGAMPTWTLDGDDRSDFNIGRSDGMLTFRATPDFDNPADADRNNIYEITVNAAIAGEDPLSMDVTITVTDDGPVNQAPQFSSSTDVRSIAENTPAGRNIGSPIMATDGDNDTLTYRLGGTDAASFAINSGTGQLMTRSALDYEARDSYSVTVTASDGNGGSDTITVTVTVTDVDEMVTTPGTLPSEVAKFDTDTSGTLEEDEVVDAIFKHVMAGDYTEAEVVGLVFYFVSNPSN